MPEEQKKIYFAIITTTVIFLLVAFSLILSIVAYNRRKKRHIDEKEMMRLTFEAELVKAQLEVQEQTLQTIGADLHDNIGQLLSLTSLTLNSIEIPEADKIGIKINSAIDLTSRAIKEMRSLGHLLQGDQLVALGLSEAIRQEINWLERSGRYQVNYTEAGDMPEESNPSKDLIFFRILQEIFNNIIKHAAATCIDISLNYSNGNLVLSVCDDGVGFTIDEFPMKQHGIGLQNIKKRVGIIGGEANIISGPGEGSRVVVSVPYT
jgi:two-component system NarL family sensor kinase